MRRLYSIFLTLCVSLSLSAQLSIWNGSSDIWTKGAGTAASPYLIESAEQFAFISDMVNGGVTTYGGTYFKLMTNIDLGNSKWVPISNFGGHIDGNNYTIIYKGDQPLFGSYFWGASWRRETIKRLHVECTNGFAKSVSSVRIIDCTYKGESAMVQEAKNSYFTNCNCTVEIPGTTTELGNYVGGIVNVATNCTFTACKVSGNISVVYDSIKNISDKQNSSSKGLACNIFAAGFVGVSEGCSYNQCSWSGNISTSGMDKWHYTDFYNFSGGIVGISAKDNIRNCQAIGDITANKPYYYWGGSAGIVGVQSNYDEKVTYVYNSFTSDSVCFRQSSRGYHATLEGKLSGGKTGTPIISNCYTITDKTETSMKSSSFPIILNTDSTVFIQDRYGMNEGYPIYKEQVYVVTSPATDIQLTSARLNVGYYALNVDSIGFEFRETSDTTHWYTRVTIDSTLTETSYKLEGLKTGTDYTYRAWVARNGAISFGDTTTFTTQECRTHAYLRTATICDGEEYKFANQILTKSGVYYETLTAINGCDSVIKLQLTVSPVNEIQKYDTIPVGDSYDFFGQILTETGTYTHYVPAGTYCNLVVMNLYVKQPSVMVTAMSTDESMGTVEGSGMYEKYSTVTLTAIPKEGYRFGSWNDGDTHAQRTIIVTSDTTLVATFEEVQCNLTLTSNDPTMGNVFGDGIYKYGKEVFINATPNTGYLFVQWSDGDTRAQRTVVVISDTTLVATFKEIQCKLTLASNDPSMGSVFGDGTYKYGSEVAVNAIPNTGYQFVQWSDNYTTAQRTLTITHDMSLTAYFQAVKYTIVATPNDESLGIVYGSGEYPYQTTVSLMAVPNEDAVFVAWTNGVATNPYTFSAVEDLSIQAIFKQLSSGTDDVEVTDDITTKIVKDGQLFIMREGKVYTIMGQEMK